ncbi:hypothetical protein GGR50DRAFT_123456 [Xylaria sp. CBS 124048]|nr:hypothetical protein GGR50DRAFT_123456 [Xylaria sp. CBS 124048]
MSSLLLDKLHVSWEKQRMLMLERHEDECMDYRRERDIKKKAAIEKAQLELEILRNTVASAAFEEQARKVCRDRDNEVANIQKSYGDNLRIIKEIQRKEKANHDAAYQDAIAARSSRTGSLLSPSASATATATATATTGNARVVDGSTFQTPPRSATSLPSKNPALPTNKSIMKNTEMPKAPKAEGSCVKKALHVNTSAGPLPTPAPTVSTAEESDAPRTVTFAEVYQNGEARHKDTIIEYPSGSDQWYILKCEEHQVRFTKRPIVGAMKHFSSRSHGGEKIDGKGVMKSWAYRVLGCTKQLAELNNKEVTRAFANGYQPIGLLNPSLAQRRADERAARATTTVRGNGQPPTKRARRRVFSAAKARPGLLQTEGNPITDPKTFHVYNCYWKTERCVYPVLILGWNDQRQGGLARNLASTGLLDSKKSRPPNCYIYQATNTGVYGGIIAWASGFEDGGPKIHRRKFPVMFFDKDQSVSWVSAKSLSKFPLFEADAPGQKSDPANTARTWIARKEGFASWEEFEKARKPKNTVKALEKGTAVPALGALPMKARNDVDDDSDTDGSDNDSAMMDISPSSPASNGTDMELQALQEKGGDTSADGDYTVSDTGSSQENELDEELGQELGRPKNRPWAFYSLRNTNTGQNGSSKPKNDTASSKSGGTEAQGFSASARNQEHNSGRKDGINEASSRGYSSKGAGDKMPKDQSGSAFSSDSIAVKQATVGTKQAAASMHTANDLPTRPLLSVAETKPIHETGTGVKRVRPEVETGMDAALSSQVLMKKPKLGKDASSNEQVAVPAEVKSGSALESSAPISFHPKTPLEPTGFELSSYEKGSIFWFSGGETPCAKLYYGERGTTVGTVNSPVDIVIDPMTLEGFQREEIPGSKGNSVMTLLGRTPGSESVRLVFDRSRGSKTEIGKIQVRSFIRWLRGVNPNIRLVEA